MISKLHYITQGDTPEVHLEHIQRACSHGAEWIQLRLKDIDEKRVVEVAKEARSITSHFQIRLIINDFYKVAKEVKADGVHLGKTDTCPEKARKYLGNLYTIGGTANTLEDCKNLVNKKVDYIGLGPFQFTKTKKNLSPVLGLKGYDLIIEELKKDIPIIAIGGITVKDVASLLETGAHGVAVSGEITQNFGAISSYHKILNTGSSQEQPYRFE